MLRHRRADSNSGARRKEFDDAPAGEPSRSLHIDIGDFNEKPAQSDSGESHVPFPNENTFRRDGSASDSSFITCI